MLGEFVEVTLIPTGAGDRLAAQCPNTIYQKGEGTKCEWTRNWILVANKKLHS